MNAILFGIDTCDQCRLARRWLADHGVPTRFHDLRRDGFDAEILDQWLTQVEGAALLNRRGLTWRRLSAEQRLSTAEPAGLAAWLLAEPLLIKRPVLSLDGRLLIGFSETDYGSLLTHPAVVQAQP